MNAQIHVDSHHHVGPVDRRIFSGFLEHIGRAVYEGVYDPGNPLSDENDFRKDVLAALRQINMPYVRYPGGNYVSAADWRDGIGPKNMRRSRPDFAWKSIETNQFGTDEFITWCKTANTAPMLAVNLGTGNARDAAELVEYCNLPGGTYWSDKRKENGHAAPHNVKLWCLGNEMDGAWQAGHCSAAEYAQRAMSASILMKGLDPTLQTVVCGSCTNSLPTYMQWDRTVLETCWDYVDYISAHRYSGNSDHDSAAFLAEGVEIDRVLDDYAGAISYVRALKKSKKNIYISFDEWNVWYKNGAGDGKWTSAPHLLEEVYNFEDAVVNMQYLTSFIRHADIVKIACIAQIVNVIAPLLTRADGMLVQSIFYPWLWASQLASGNSLRMAVDVPTCPAGKRGEAPAIDSAATYDPATGQISLLLVNRSLTQEITVDFSVADRNLQSVTDNHALGGGTMALTTANSWENPHQVIPAQALVHIVDGKARITVPGPGIAAIRFATQSR